MRPGYHLVILAFFCAIVYCCLMLSVPVFRCQEYDSSCICFFVSSLFLVLLTSSYWCLEIIVSVL